jgi:DNA-binding NarL/FixJ family response regulator
MNEPIRLLLVDDQRLMRDGLRTLLELEPDLEVVGEAENGEAALKLFLELNPDVILMDIRMPVMDGVEATRRLRADDPNVKIIILTTFDDNEYVFEGLRAGALGYLLKDVSGPELAEAIRTVAAGGSMIEPSVARKVVAEFARLAPPTQAARDDLIDPLSDREIEILQCVAQGLTNKEIASKLFLAEGTVKNYVTSILQKIGARDRTQAAIRARELGLLDTNNPI